jgi:hypothetical protein
MYIVIIVRSNIGAEGFASSLLMVTLLGLS